MQGRGGQRKQPSLSLRIFVWMWVKIWHIFSSFLHVRQLSEQYFQTQDKCLGATLCQAVAPWLLHRQAGRQLARGLSSTPQPMVLCAPAFAKLSVKLCILCPYKIFTQEQFGAASVTPWAEGSFLFIKETWKFSLVYQETCAGDTQNSPLLSTCFS